MLPIMLNPKSLKFLLLGQGEKMVARAAKLTELGISYKSYYPPYIKLNFAEYDVVLIVGLDEDLSGKLYHEAKAERCLVNVEDNKKYCDFFFQSFVKRGKLLISVSTGGNSPATAKIVRDKIEETFPPEWEDYMDEIAQKRIEWKAAGKSYDEVNELTKDHMKRYIT